MICKTISILFFCLTSYTTQAQKNKLSATVGLGSFINYQPQYRSNYTLDISGTYSKPKWKHKSLWYGINFSQSFKQSNTSYTYKNPFYMYNNKYAATQVLLYAGCQYKITNKNTLGIAPTLGYYTLGIFKDALSTMQPDPVFESSKFKAENLGVGLLLHYNKVITTHWGVGLQSSLITNIKRYDKYVSFVNTKKQLFNIAVVGSYNF